MSSDFHGSYMLFIDRPYIDNARLTHLESIRLSDRSIQLARTLWRTLPMTLAPEAGVTGKELKIIRGACPHDCPDTCAMLYHVEDGKLVDVKGDPDHPMTTGGLCVKLKDFPEHHYQSHRLMHPLRRVGPKGAGEFERITWDEALAEIKSRWTSIIDE